MRRHFNNFHFVSLLDSDPGGPPPDSYMTYYWKPSSSLASSNRKNYETITLLESRTTIESGTTGLRTWCASFVLASYLIANAGMVDTHCHSLTNLHISSCKQKRFMIKRSSSLVAGPVFLGLLWRQYNRNILMSVISHIVSLCLRCC